MEPEQRFGALVDAFAGRPGVGLPGESHQRGFGSSALKVNGSIFAMLSGGRLVVKLPRERVDALIRSEIGRSFDAGKGRPMKEWLTVSSDDEQVWLALAQEALEFVAQLHRLARADLFSSRAARPVRSAEGHGHADVPRDLPLVERRGVRLVVLDGTDRVLLFHTRDPSYPELGTWWELPGGGTEAGETDTDTAVRELREEAGITIGAECVGRGTWRRDASFRYRGERRLQHETVLPIRLGTPGPAVDGSRRVGFEDEDYFGFRWWTVDEILDSNERFYPGRLPELLPRFLLGTEIEEPFELWS